MFLNVSFEEPAKFFLQEKAFIANAVTLQHYKGDYQLVYDVWVARFLCISKWRRSNGIDSVNLITVSSHCQMLDWISFPKGWAVSKI